MKDSQALSCSRGPSELRRDASSGGNAPAIPIAISLVREEAGVPAGGEATARFVAATGPVSGAQSARRPPPRYCTRSRGVARLGKPRPTNPRLCEELQKLVRG